MSHRVKDDDTDDIDQLKQLRAKLYQDRTIRLLRAMLVKIATAYSDDPGTSDLYDEQPVSSVPSLNLGDVRLARRLLR